MGLAADTQGKEIEFVEIADWPQYTVGIFLVPKGRKLPLHDHPGMTVLSKVLFGKMAITSFDKVDYSRDICDRDYRIPIKTVIRTVSKEFTSFDGCNILYSTSGGNLHEFLATGKLFAFFSAESIQGRTHVQSIISSNPSCVPALILPASLRHQPAHDDDAKLFPLWGTVS